MMLIMNLFTLVNDTMPQGLKRSPRHSRFRSGNLHRYLMALAVLLLAMVSSCYASDEASSNDDVLNKCKRPKHIWKAWGYGFLAAAAAITAILFGTGLFGDFFGASSYMKIFGILMGVGVFCFACIKCHMHKKMNYAYTGNYGDKSYNESHSQLTEYGQKIRAKWGSFAQWVTICMVCVLLAMAIVAGKQSGDGGKMMGYSMVAATFCTSAFITCCMIGASYSKFDKIVSIHRAPIGWLVKKLTPDGTLTEYFSTMSGSLGGFKRSYQLFFLTSKTFYLWIGVLALLCVLLSGDDFVGQSSYKQIATLILGSAFLIGSLYVGVQRYRFYSNMEGDTHGEWQDAKKNTEGKKIGRWAIPAFFGIMLLLGILMSVHAAASGFIAHHNGMVVFVTLSMIMLGGTCCGFTIWKAIQNNTAEQEAKTDALCKQLSDARKKDAAYILQYRKENRVDAEIHDHDVMSRKAFKAWKKQKEEMHGITSDEKFNEQNNKASIFEAEMTSAIGSKNVETLVFDASDKTPYNVVEEEMLFDKAKYNGEVDDVSSLPSSAGYDADLASNVGRKVTTGNERRRLATVGGRLENILKLS